MHWCEGIDHFIPFPKFGLCLSEVAFNKEIKRLKIKEAMPFLKNCQAHATAHSLVNDDGSEIIIITVGSTKGRSKQAVYGLIAHEATHIWQRAKIMMGEESPSSEFEAYSIQFICTQLFHAYEELKAKR